MKAPQKNRLKLSQLGSIARGKSKHRPRNDPALYGGKYPFIQTGDVKHSNLYITEYSQTSNEKGLAQSKLWNPGTLCITIAANIADTAILKIPACFPDSIIGFIADQNNADVRFVKYCIDTYRLQIQSISRGTTQDNLSLEKLLSINLKIPSIISQQKIAAILSAYDDLIENNKRRITLLEKMAEGIYREWFVRMRFPGHGKAKFKKGVPTNWTIQAIGAICKRVTDGSHLSPEFHANGKYMASVRDMQSYGFTFKSMKTISGQDFQKLVKADCKPLKNDVLIAKDGSYLKHVFVWNHNYEIVILSSIAILRPNMDLVLPYFLSLVLKQNSTKSMMSGYVSGSALPRIILKDFMKMKLLIPEFDLVKQFESIAEPLFYKINILDRQIQKFEITRDKLLSRIVSGKLPVESLDIQFPPRMQTEQETAHA